MSLALREFGLKLNRRLLANEGVLNPRIMRLLTRPDRHVTMGRWSGFDGMPSVFVYPGAPDERVEVGSFTSIAKDVTFMISGHHDYQRVTTWPARKMWGGEDYDSSGEVSGRGTIVIGNDVWIGRGATILSGARIGDGAVIGANAVVSSTIAPYAIAVGNPAREVRKRFDEGTIARLLASAWWDLPDEVLRGAVDLMASRDVDGFLGYVESVRSTQSVTADVCG
jgi:acetyltransferase-like isoleucine patch superfamily enzyme